MDMVEKLEDIDVDEIAGLIDFGIEEERVLRELEKLNVVRVLVN